MQSHLEGGEPMQVEVQIDASHTEPKIIILAASVTEEVDAILKKLSDDVPQIISAAGTVKLKSSNRLI